MSVYVGYVLYKEGVPVGVLIAPKAADALKRAAQLGIDADEAQRVDEDPEDYRLTPDTAEAG